MLAVSMRQRRRLLLSFGVIALIAIAASCREPTQITLRITSGEKCTDLTGVQIVVGPDAEVTQRRFTQHYAAALTHACTPSGTDNLIGTLVVTPGQSSGTVVVSAGINLVVNGAVVPGPDPASCADATMSKQCIIARRSFSFIDHTSLTLPIDLDPLCVGKVCDPASTCFKGGCVPDTVGCQGESCLLPQESGQGQGSASDASSSDGAYDADIGDAFSIDDSSTMTDGGEGGTIVDATMESSTDANVPDCLFVTDNMKMTMLTICDHSLGDNDDNKTCTGTANAMIACCHCRCTKGGNAGLPVSCEVGMGIGSSCHPTACSP